MPREIASLTDTRFDLLVVGGGVHGLAAAYDAAQRGLRVALVERGDFGSGSSFNHQKTAHGGLRYLQTGDLARARQSVLERRTLARIAPHLLHPLPFVLPTYRSLTSGRLALRAGFLLDRMVGFDRDTGLDTSRHLPAGYTIDRESCLARFPGVTRRGLTGAGVWHDYQMSDAERLTMAFATAAREHGAILANYTEAQSPVRRGPRLTGFQVRDLLDDRDFEITASVTLLAAGAGTGPLLALCGIPGSVPLLQAMNVVTSRDAAHEALGGRTKAGRHLFLTPWRRRALIGTWESGATCAPDATIGQDQVDAFIAEINQAFPPLDLTRRDVTLVHRGVVPADVRPDGRVTLKAHHEIREHGRDGLHGLVSLVGVKYTTARGIAEEAVNVVCGLVDTSADACRTATTPLPGGERPDLSALSAETQRHLGHALPSEVIGHLVDAYGARYRAITDLIDSRPELATPLGGGHPVIGAEIIHAGRTEMVCTLTDAVVRRTGLGAAGYPGDEPARRAAELLAGELGWDAARVARELAALRRFYAPLAMAAEA
jgi:glycerol-3-phosphate dehydrogenase